MTPKLFLQLGGVALVLLGVLGFAGIIGPTAQDSIFHSTWWFDDGENWAHLILGIVALIAAFALPGTLQKPLVIILGIVGVLIGLYSVAVSQTFLGANLENPADSLLHIIVGLWALVAGFKGKSM